MRKSFLLWLIAFSFLSVNAQQKFRVIGYLRTNNILDGQAGQVDYSKVTHINIAFINPDSAGNFTSMPGLKAFADKMHGLHIKVLASIGGGLAPVYYTSLLADGNRLELAQKLAQLSESYDLDGIDVDLEGERVDTNYENFITTLSAVLKPKGKLLTAAVATVYKERYTDKALAQFDFISIMSYDKTGPWRPEKPGPHAPYEMAAEDMNYWAGEKGIAKEKLNLGLPFYGYGFGPGAPADMSFGKIVSTYRGAEDKDEWAFPEGGTLYYNGIPTIKNKTTLALQQAGGVMIWQLLGDAQGKYSLLSAVNELVSKKK